MEPSPTPPWRILETPPEPGTSSPRITDPTPAGGRASVAKVTAVAAAAIGCAVLAIVLATSSDGGVVRVDGGSPLPMAGSSDAGASSATVGGELVAEIVGAVPNPGVYRLPPGSRLADLVRSAGGYGPRVDIARAERELNLAALVEDGQHIRVPSRDDIEAASAIPSGQAAGPDRVDVNTATQAELEELPGIGPATAEKIIAAREEARFGAIEELRSRGVLGEKTFEKLRDLVTVG